MESSKEVTRAALLRYAGVRAVLASLAVSPLGMIALTVLVERRSFVPADQYLSFLVGDVLIAGAVGVGFSVKSTAQWPRPAHIIVPVVIGLGCGAWQLHHELSAAIYTPGEAYSPTKLWHQFVIYPAMGTLLLGASVRAHHRPRAVMAMAVFLLGWAVLNVWDQHHPKDPHCDFSWTNWTDGCSRLT